MKTIKTIDITAEIIEKLEAVGSRWTKYGKDRVYFSAEDFDALEISTYSKSGQISSAKLDGETISNSEAGRILSMDLYVDLATGAVIVDDRRGAKAAERIEELFLAKIDEITAEPEEEEETSEYTVIGVKGETTVQVSEDFTEGTGTDALEAFVRGFTDQQIDSYYSDYTDGERRDIKTIVHAYATLGGYVAYDDFYPSIVGRCGEGLKEITEGDPLWEADCAYKSAARAESICD